VRENDPAFHVLRYNEMTMDIEISGPLPWRNVDNRPEVDNDDMWNFVHYVEREFGIRISNDFMRSLVSTHASKNRRNPVREYLESLEWDGTERVETCLPGVRPTPTSRMIARKSMVAAVARALDPGCKWDHTLVLYGLEGLGKSWWVEKIARGYSATLGNISNKDTLMTMQRSWIVVSDEGHSLRKAEQETLKEFLTRTHDTYRVPFDRGVVRRPRHCVIWSTTNDRTFLSNQEGNRRFLIVNCQDRVDFDAVTDEYVDQLWAEAVVLYQAGEPLFLEESEALLSKRVQNWYTEEDALSGTIQEYLDTRVPDKWWEWSPELRCQWLSDLAQGFVVPGSERIDRTCSIQIWVEALGRRRGDHRRVDLIEITNALKSLPGWAQSDGRVRVPGYGPQTVFVREDAL
jgi:putative DNA primase/helicase